MASDLNESSPDSMVIEIGNARKLQFLWDKGEFEKVFNNSNYWTKIKIIQGASYDKDLVLRTILHSVYPVAVFPALFQIDGEDAFFLVRNCSNFIRKLAMTALKASHPTGKYHFDLSITTNYLPTSIEPLNVHSQIRIALNRRYNQNAKTIDLTNFSQDEHFKDIYFHLNIPQCMVATFEMIKQNFNTGHINTVILAHNDLQSLEHFELKNSIVELDLRHNNLNWEGFEKLAVKRGMKLNQVWLDGNPLCLNITETEFIKRVDTVIPYVKKVDGVDVSNVFFGYSSIRNFFHDGSWAQFVDHFLHHYFGLMESPNRYHLSRMYHQKASFSFSAYHNQNEEPVWSKLSNYMPNSRNILTFSDMTKAYTTLKVGPEEIISILNSFPVIQFDPHSFTVDVPFAQVNGMILINVGGIFQELNTGLFYFHRTFILSPFKKNVGEWKIDNDMMTITPATAEQAEKSFLHVRGSVAPKMQISLNPSTKNQDLLLPIVCDITKLNENWAKRFLEEASWDLEMTLLAFTDQLKSNQIPMIAFSI